MSDTPKTDTLRRSEQISDIEKNSNMAIRIERQLADVDQRVQEYLNEYQSSESTATVPKPEEVWIWGVPYSRLTLEQTLAHIDRLIAARQPGYFITANLNYNMLTDRHPELREVNAEASFILVDGMPMVWRSKLTKQPLPERVPGSELIYALSKWSAVQGHSIYFLGGAPGVAASAAEALSERYPGLKIAGIDSPPFRKLTQSEQDDIILRIQQAKPDILYVALGQPKGEKWMHENRAKLGVPVCVQLGASFDFVAGCVPRSPRWIQNIGMEWFYRFWKEPRRLGPRYFGNGTFLIKAIWKELLGRKQH